MIKKIISVCALMLISNISFGSELEQVAKKGADNNFSLSKNKLELSHGQKSDYLTVFNKGDKEVVGYSVQIFKWSLKEGKDIYEPTNNVIVTPKTFLLQPNQYKNIRLMINNLEEGFKDNSYRIFISQISRKDIEEKVEKENKLKIHFTVTVPIFVQKEDFKEYNKLNIVTKFNELDKMYEVENKDNQYIFLKSIKIDDKEYNYKWYLLPNTSYKFPLEKINNKTVTLITDRGSFEK